MKKVVEVGHAHIGHSLVDDLLHLDRGDADDERRTEHDALLTQRLASNHRSQLDHHPCPGVKVAMTEHFVEREVVE